METLTKQGLIENTLVIITSDNGPVLFDGYWDGAIERQDNHRASGPFRGGKYNRWEGGTRMPLVVSWPAQMRAIIEEVAPEKAAGEKQLN